MAAAYLAERNHCDEPLVRNGLACGVERHSRRFAHCWRAGRVGAADLLERFLSQFAPRCINHLGTDSRPLVAVLSFVCSVGNIPLAAVLWNGGISFGGVIAFIYADLIVFPIINIYRKYYGWKVTALIVAVFYIAMALAALIVEFLFSLLRLIPQHRSAQIVETTISLNYTTMLNVLFLAIAAFLLGRFFRTGGPKMLAHMD